MTFKDGHVLSTSCVDSNGKGACLTVWKKIILRPNCQTITNYESAPVIGKKTTTSGNVNRHPVVYRCLDEVKAFILRFHPVDEGLSKCRNHRIVHGLAASQLFSRLVQTNNSNYCWQNPLRSAAKIDHGLYGYYRDVHIIDPRKASTRNYLPVN